MATDSSLEFCSSFDRVLALEGPAAVFTPNREGLWRLAPNWTRNAYDGDAEEGTAGSGREWRWVLARDRDTAFVQLLLCTGPALLRVHPRVELRHYEDLASAQGARALFGQPPLCRESWT
jgi:hypothetical protein